MQPLWIRIADGAVLALLALVAWKVVSDDTRVGIFGLIPLVSIPILLYAAGAIAILRHVAVPSPSTFARWREGWRRISEAPDWGPAVRTFVSTRVMVFVVAFFAIVSFGAGKPGFELSPRPLENMPARFDAGYYGAIALYGYDRDRVLDRQRNIAFFPMMPMLMKPVGRLFGAKTAESRELRMLRYLWAGVFVSLVAFLFALYYLMRLGTFLLDAERAQYAVLLIASYPFACFYNAPYTESLFLLGTVATSYHFLRGQFAYAGIWGLVVGLTRPNGFMLAVPLGLLALQQWRVKGLLAASMPVVGMLGFTVYLYAITGIWFAWQKIQPAWGRRFTGLEPMARGWGWLSDEGFIQVATNIPFDVLNTAAAILAIGLLWVVYRRIGAVWAVYVALTILPPMFMGGALSLGRMSSTLFPLFLALAAILPSRAVPSWVTAFAIGQGLCAALFFTWRELF
jgi:hypothetical protein